mgnify:CR=1 FL=1
MKSRTTLFFPGLFFCILFQTFPIYSQQVDRPVMIAGKTEGSIKLDGILNEPDWENAPIADQFKTIVPVEGGEPSGRTQVRVLAHPRFLVIGIQCFDDDPKGIVNFSKLRDVELENEDHIRIVIDPFLDGQSGLIFAVNANGARYDALVSNRGESENEAWDAIWEAKTIIDSSGWSVEIRIPIQSISFKKGLTEWGFNIERRIQRFQETIRWTNIRRDQWFIQTSRAGLLTNLPDFNYGLGLNVRPSLIANASKAGNAPYDFGLDPSLDASQRISPNVVATVTVNTDFAETEVDTRQTNLTRFPLFFPEKRAFFLEGADIFEFGFGLRDNIIPFFSRRIGLYEGNEVPILAGGKLNGRTGKTAFGGLVMRTRELTTVEDSLAASTMGVVRVKQNVLKESSFGFIGTFGDPQNRGNSWTSGADFTYQTTRFRGDKNFLVGISGMYANQPDLSGDQSALAFKADYPNDIWDLSLTYFRIGDAFDPALGFVPRKGINSWRVGMTYAPRPSWKWLRQMRNQLFISYITDLEGNWETYRIFTAPINWRLESGDRVEINYMPRGERLIAPFEISNGIIIPEGEYHFARYRLETELAAKRKLNGQLTWWFGTFYEGNLHEFEATLNWNPTNILTFEFIGVHNIGRLPFGNFDQTLLGLRVRFNASPDLQLNSFIQYDTDTKSLGINARIHWIFHPQGEIFLVINHNTFDGLERWELINQQILLKARYNFRL